MHISSSIAFAFGEGSDRKVQLEETPLFVPWYEIQRNSL